MNATPAQAGLYIHDVDRRNSFRRLARRNVGLVIWSPNGARIAWGTARGLFTIGAVGGSPTRIGGSVNVTSWYNGSSGLVPNVVWSPDGKRIAYSSSGAIFTARALGGTPVRITPADGYRHPTWSPDGSRIAFTRDRLTYRSASECRRINTAVETLQPGRVLGPTLERRRPQPALQRRPKNPHGCVRSLPCVGIAAEAGDGARTHDPQLGEANTGNDGDSLMAAIPHEHTDKRLPRL